MPYVTVKMFEGRTDEQKRALCEKVTEAVAETTGAPAENVVVFIEEMSKNALLCRWKTSSRSIIKLSNKGCAFRRTVSSIQSEPAFYSFIRLRTSRCTSLIKSNAAVHFLFGETSIYFSQYELFQFVLFSQDDRNIEMLKRVQEIGNFSLSLCRCKSASIVVGIRLPFRETARPHLSHCI